MDMEKLLIGCAIGGAATLIGKIIWDWLKGGNNKEFLKALIQDLKDDINKDFEILSAKIDTRLGGYVPWDKWDEFKLGEFKDLEKKVTENRIKIEGMKK